MSTVKFTPGPWLPDIMHYKKAPKEIYTGIKVTTDTPDYYQRIFDVVLPNTDKAYIEEHEKIKANVLLACAAPELYEALQELLQWHEDNAEDSHISSALYEKAKAALIKAEGGNP